MSIQAPPEGFNQDDLAGPLLTEMGVGRTQANMLAAAEALRMKASHPGFTIAKAYVFIGEMWLEYKRSDRYKSQYRRRASDWLAEADYDNPPSWGGKSLLERKPKPRQMSEVEMWRRDKELHPEKYPTPEETREFLAKLDQMLKQASQGKRMI